MKRLLAYLFVVLGLGLVFSANANSKIYCVDEKIGERIENFREDYLKRENEFFYTSKAKGTVCMTSYTEVNKKQYNLLKEHFSKAKSKIAKNQNDNNDTSLKAGIKINKKDKVPYSKFGGQRGYDIAYFYLKAHKINDLRGDGIVYYKFDQKIDNIGTYYRLNKDHKVISTGDFEFINNKKAFELTEDNEKFYWKISMSNGIADIKSKAYDYKGYRRYEFVEASTKEQDKIYSSIKKHRIIS